MAIAPSLMPKAAEEQLEAASYKLQAINCALSCRLQFVALHRSMNFRELFLC